jgi:hypothetical protein
MRKGFLGCLSALLVSAHLAYAEAPEPWKAAPRDDEAAPPVKSTGAAVIPGQDKLGELGTASQPAASPYAAPGLDKAKDKVITLPTPQAVDATKPPAADLPADGEVAGGPYGGNGPSVGWFSAEYIYWWLKRQNLPPLVTTSPDISQGILGQPGTQVLFGGDNTPDNRGHSGVRVYGGIWLDCEQCWNLDFSAFLLPRFSNTTTIGSQFSNMLLARPFFSLNTMTPTSELDSEMGLSKGTKTISLPQRFWGAEVDLSHKLCCGCCYRADLLAGFRFLELDESVEIGEFIKVANPITNPNFQNFMQFAGDTIQVSDRFSTRNQFYGGKVGIDAAFAHGPWQLELRGLVALGDTHEIIDISGSQSVTTPAGMTTNFTGGLLALPSNIGHFTHNEFAVVPEATVNVGYRFTHCCLVYVGYNFLYWSRVVRPGDQIDTVVDTSQIPNFGTGTSVGIARPAVPFKQSDFWAQGFDVGIELSW